MTGKLAVGAALAVLAVFALPATALLLGVCILSGGAAPAAAGPAVACAGSGPLAGLSDAAAANARVVATVATGRAGPAAAVVALTAALTESGLRNLGNPVVPASERAAIQGLGHNLDSLGIFQQRASWGTVAQRLDPAISTDLFLVRLLGDPGWWTKPVWVAAQDVQRSSFDGTSRAANDGNSGYGANYAAHAGEAAALVASIDREASARRCGALSGGAPADPAPGSHGLPSGYTVPVSATPAEARVIGFALAQLDKAYRFGAAGPQAFDCSGLTMSAWQQGGVTLPHSTVGQANSGSPTTSAGLRPADLVLVAGDDGSLTQPGHVGLYLGAGLVLNAADEHDGIRVQSFANFVQVGHGLSTLRHLG